MSNNDVRSGVCYIICASSDIGGFHIDKQSEDYIICADAGYAYAREMHIEPDMILGDFDSFGVVPEHNNVVVHSVEKDDADSVLAVREGLKMGYKKFVILGGLGGRRPEFDITNIQLLHYIACEGGRGYLVKDNLRVTVIKDTSICLFGRPKEKFSVFSLDAHSYGVCIAGAKYLLDNYTLTNINPIGVSNEFSGSPCTVSVKNGSLLIATYKNDFVWY